MIKKEIEGKELKQVLHFRFSFKPRFSEVDKFLFLAPPLRTTSCIMYTIVDRYDNERETWSKSSVGIVTIIRKLRIGRDAITCKKRRTPTFRAKAKGLRLNVDVRP